MLSLHRIPTPRERDLRSDAELKIPATNVRVPSSGLTVLPRWTISNILSLSRIVLLIPIVVLILNGGSGHRIAVLGLMLVAAATDFFDGLIARALNQVSEFGKLLDPVADKICVVTAVAALVTVGDVPLWYAILVAIRDILIVVGSSIILSRRKIVVQSVWTGKFTVAFVAAYIILATARIDSFAYVESFFLYLSTLFLFASLAVYIRVYRRRMAGTGV